MAVILVQIPSFFAIAPELGIWEFSGSLITNLVSVLQNSKWKTENGSDVSVSRKCFGNCYETWYTGIFGIADFNLKNETKKTCLPKILQKIYVTVLRVN